MQKPLARYPKTTHLLKCLFKCKVVWSRESHSVPYPYERPRASVVIRHTQWRRTPHARTTSRNVHESSASSSPPPCVHKLIRCSCGDAIARELPTNSHKTRTQRGKEKKSCTIEARFWGSQWASPMNGRSWAWDTGGVTLGRSQWQQWANRDWPVVVAAPREGTLLNVDDIRERTAVSYCLASVLQKLLVWWFFQRRRKRGWGSCTSECVYPEKNYGKLWSWDPLLKSSNKQPKENLGRHTLWVYSF